MSVESIYSALPQIGMRLSSIGLEEWTGRLQVAVSGGSMSGEILMAVRWNLRELKRKVPGLPEELETEIDRVIDLINQTGA